MILKKASGSNMKSQCRSSGLPFSNAYVKFIFTFVVHFYDHDCLYPYVRASIFAEAFLYMVHHK